MARVGLLVLALVTLPSLASAEPSKPKEQQRVLTMPTVIIEAERQTPKAFYILERSIVDYEWQTMEQDFLPRILLATGKHPF
jgi:hypothetical protein